MIRVCTFCSVKDAMKEIVKSYEKEPPYSFKKQIRLQIGYFATREDGFAYEFENAVNGAFPNVPELKDINKYIDEMVENNDACLVRYGVIEQAKRIADIKRHDAFYFEGHKMKTPEQKELCEDIMGLLWDWWGDITQEWNDITLLVEQKYETKTGKSCVNWQSVDGQDCDLHDTLPRKEDYTTSGYTKGFENWVVDLIVKIVTEGADTREAVAKKIKEECKVRQ